MNVQKLKGVMAERGYNQRKLAREMGISEPTIYSKVKKGVFGSDEIMRIMSILHLSKEETCEIFLTE